MHRVVVIGSGFSGLSASCFLAAAGFDVTVVEKNGTPGGRARSFESDGFTFDMGPSWYWMPDVFERFFSQFNKQPADYYQLIRLDPSYRIVFGARDHMDLPANLDHIKDLFEKVEPGSGTQLLAFLKESKFKYDLAMNKLVYLPGQNITELADANLLKGLLKLHVFQPVSKYVRKFFSDPKLVQLLEFPALFLGAKPQNTPALYSLMNYADMVLGTWYPPGGMNRIVDGMVSLAESLGVKFKFNCTANHLEITSNKATGVRVNGDVLPCEYVVASADYHHVEHELLPITHRNYSESNWKSKILAPSSLIFYLGLNKKLEGLLHHTLFFDKDFDTHASEIYDHPKWPTSPQFYVSCPSKSDPLVSPEGCENLMILIPVAAGLEDREEIRDHYFNMVMNRMEALTMQKIRPYIIFKRSYAHRDFINDYNAFEGNAYGLANTLLQTANLRPSIVNKKVRNLFYTGQLTVPGPGVPPAIISGEVAARLLIKKHREFVT